MILLAFPGFRVSFVASSSESDQDVVTFSFDSFWSAEPDMEASSGSGFGGEYLTLMRILRRKFDGLGSSNSVSFEFPVSSGKSIGSQSIPLKDSRIMSTINCCCSRFVCTSRLTITGSSDETNA